MKSFLAIFAIISILSLVSCTANSDSSSSEQIQYTNSIITTTVAEQSEQSEQTTTDQIEQTTAIESVEQTEETIMTSEQSEHIEETDTATEPTETSSTETISAEQKIEIQALLNDYSRFCYDFFEYYNIIDNLSDGSFITIEEVLSSDETYNEKWYLISKGDITTWDELELRMKAMLTENGIKDLPLEYYYREENGNLYVSESIDDHGSLLGTDTVYVKSAEKLDDSTIRLYMTAFGDKDNWEGESDTSEDFTVDIKITSEGLRIDVCESVARIYITWCYTSEDDMF